MRKRIIIVAIVLTLSYLTYTRLTGKSLTENLASNLISPLGHTISRETPLPTPFYEITIPALRARSYQSSLQELKLYREQPNYTSYLTSYASDGLKINGLLTKPKGEMPPGGWPAIVFVHGYIPPTLYKTTEKYVDYVNYLAKRGFVVFKIDLRGHGASEGEPGGAYYSSDYIIDTLNALRALQSADFVGDDRIGLWGHSMAGNVVFRALIAKPEIKAAVIWAGAVYTYEDMRKYGINDNSYRPPTTNTRRKREELTKMYGDFSTENDFWKQVAATNYLDGVTSALQIHHAQDDAVVSINYSRNLSSILDNSKITHELYEYPAGGHNISGNNFTAAMARTAEFFTTRLK
jgi:uncharacterized protein